MGRGGTVVFQSWRAAGAGPPWVEVCLASVRGWAERSGFAYRRLGDELFARVPEDLRDKLTDRPMIQADLGRLAVAAELLAEGFERAVWLDADVLLFAPERLRLPAAGEASCFFGREQWVQLDERGRPRAFAKVHNALCGFSAGDPVLPFLLHASLRLLERYEGLPPPHLVGPRLLAPLHNLVGFTLVEELGSLGPPVLAELLAGGGPCTELVRRRTPGGLAGANLCASLVDEGYEGTTQDDAEMQAAVERLLAEPARLGPTR